MKKILKFYLIMSMMLIFGISNFAFAQTAQNESFKVYGNCEMCKDRIEGALKKKEGILKKNWNENTKILTVIFDSSKISLTQIKQKIANSGYDTDEIHATDQAYNSLPKCCQYSRAKSVETIKP